MKPISIHQPGVALAQYFLELNRKIPLNRFPLSLKYALHLNDPHLQSASIDSWHIVSADWVLIMYNGENSSETAYERCWNEMVWKKFGSS